MPPASRSWSLDRIWEHAIHEDELLASHLQNFLLFESILFLALGAMVAGDKFTEVRFPFGIAGILLAIVWLGLLERHAFYIDVLAKRLKGELPTQITAEDYRTTREQFKPRVWFLRLGILASFNFNHFISILVPVIVIVLWACLTILIR